MLLLNLVSMPCCSPKPLLHSKEQTCKDYDLREEALQCAPDWLFDILTTVTWNP